MAARTHSLFDREIIVQAVVDSFKKLNPLSLLKNPVIFVTEVGAALTTVGLFFRSGDEPLALSFRSRSGSGSRCSLPILQRPWPKDGERPRPSPPKDTHPDHGQRVKIDGSVGNDLSRTAAERMTSSRVSAGEIIPADGEIIEGVATVDESAITGESAPVIREAGGDRSAVTGGTRVLSDQIKVRVTANPGESFLDRMIGLVEGARRQKTPNEIALTILLSAMTIIFLVVIITLKPFGLYSGVSLTITVWWPCWSA